MKLYTDLPRLKLYSVLLIVMVLSLACSMDMSSISFIERAAFDEGVFEKDARISITYGNRPLFDGANVYELCDESTEPYQCAFVVDCSEKVFIFSSYGSATYRDSGKPSVSKHYLKMANQFFELTQCKHIKLTSDNIQQYIDVFTEIAAYKSNRLNNINEIKWLPPYLKPELEPYSDDINNPIVEVRDNKITLQFYSWRYRGYILKWNLLLEKNGRCISCNVEKVLDLRFLK